MPVVVGRTRSGSLLLALLLVFALTLVVASSRGESLSSPAAQDAAVSAIAIATTTTTTTTTTSGDVKVRHWFKFPALFDFTTYQKLYRKSYRSAMERTARLGLYLARTHRVFVSAVKYQQFSASYYLGINTRSDWTPAEIDSIQNRLEEPQQPVQEPSGGQQVANFAGVQGDPDYKPLDSLTISRELSRHYGQMLNRGVAAAANDRSPRARLARLTKSLGRKMIGKSRESKKLENEQQQQQEPLEDALWVDHRRSGCLAEIQDQGLCGACYIFASLAYLEWAHCRETGNLIKFSEQYLVDCGSQRVRGLHGCAHGLVTQVGVFVNNFGLETAHGYGREYAAQMGQCPHAPGAPLASMGSVKLDMQSVVHVPLEHLEEVLEDAPLVVNIGTSRELYEYGGGVYDGLGCSKTGHHSVLLIGHGRENGEEYWLLRNSQSTSYGESGHLRLNKNSECITPQMGFMFGRYADRKVRILPITNQAKQGNSINNNHSSR